jgi:hypothetical protein
VSAFGVEAAMHDIARHREFGAAFQADPDEVLAKKPLNAEQLSAAAVARLAA